MSASSPFAAFAHAAERIAATSKRTAKTDHLAAYFASLGDDDLRLAARYVAGRLFPLHDQRTVSVGPAALRRALATVSGADEATLQRRLVALGDLGDVAAEVLPERSPNAAASGLTLPTVGASFAALAAVRGTKRKTQQVTDLLRGAGALEAKYLVKLLQGNLRIGFKEGGVEATLARMAEVPVGVVQRANMLVGDLGEVALLARQRRLDTARLHLFHPIKFMLATAADDAQEVARQMPERFAVEDKFDGIRAQAHIGKDPGADGLYGVVRDGVRVALFSRTLDALTPAFPDLVAPLAALYASAPKGLILDGEIVPVEGARVLPFQTLQARLGRKKVSPEVQRSLPVAFVAYDVLVHDGRVLLDAPYTDRRRALEVLPLAEASAEAALRRAAVTWLDDPDELAAAFEAARARGHEGLMVKHPASPYKPGRRGRDWLKRKQPLATLDVVVTAVEVGHGKRRHLLSDYTFAVRQSADDPTLLNVGKAYSGLTDAELAELTTWFKAHTRQQFAHGRVRLVDPEVVLEVAFDRVQPSPRHKSGYALRFPRIVRLRPDKPVEEIDTLETVRHLAAPP